MTTLFMVFRFESTENRTQETFMESEQGYKTFVRKESTAPTRYLVDKP